MYLNFLLMYLNFLLMYLKFLLMYLNFLLNSTDLSVCILAAKGQVNTSRELVSRT